MNNKLYKIIYNEIKLILKRDFNINSYTLTQKGYMITLTTTRFNTKTWNERKRWMERNNWVSESGCIYGTPVCVKEDVFGTMIVLEMHNDENRVKAI